MQAREGRALGSPLRLLVAAGADGRAIDEAWPEVVRAFEDVDRAMSRYRADSELTRLNRLRGEPARVSRLLMAALALAERARRITAGRFDPRVVVDLERLGFAAAPQAWARRPPGDEPLLRRAPDGCIALSAPVDLGGLGKGIALRRACRAAAARLPGAGLLIDAGGDIVTLGRPDPANAASRWSIAIEDPSGAGEPMATFALPDRWAVATSSTRIARRLDDAGLMVHHLIDPRTGTPGGGGLVAVTVAFPDPAWAEVWTKELFLEGPSGIGARARGRGLAAWWVGPDGSLSMTPAARQVTTWVRSEVELSPPAASVARRPPSPNPATG